MGSDGGIPSTQLKALEGDPAFAAAEHIQGTHYPCSRDQPPSFWGIVPAQTYWANEDFSTIGGDWAGGSCWGRSLSQNFVKLNATATISWSTIWSVYDSWRYFGNGLMYAMQPWNGNYTVPPAIWTSAHVNQFSAPGWHYLGGEGTGLLPGGGSWTAMVPPPADQLRQATVADYPRSVATAAAGDLTLVIEKLEGDCLRCKVPTTTAETVSFQLTGQFARISALKMWLTNGTVSFVQLEPLAVHGGAFSVRVPRDTMLTLSTTVGQAKGQASTCVGAAICSGVYRPFPFPWNDTYDSGEVNRMAKYHADNGGAFEIRADPSGSGKHLFQASPRYPAGTQWAGNFDPITSIGATDWSNYRVAAKVMLMAPAPKYALGDTLIPFPTKTGMLTDKTADPISKGVYAGVCVRQIDQYSSGFCLLVGVGLVVGQPDEENDLSSGVGWVLQAGKLHMARHPGTALRSGSLPASFDLSVYHEVSLSVVGQTLEATIDGQTVATVVNTARPDIPPVGQAALRSSFSYAQFDDLVIDGGGVELSAYPAVVFDKHLLWPPKPAPGGPQDPSQPLSNVQPGSLYGISFTVGATPLKVGALGRFAAGFVANGTHRLSVIDADTKAELGAASVALDTAHGGDLNGYAWAALPKPLTLQPGKSYFVVSEEDGKDVLYDSKVWMQAKPNLLEGLPTPIYKDQQGWHASGKSGNVPVPPGALGHLHYIVSASTSECFDTRSQNSLDLWACVADGHNELFNYSWSTGRIITGPRDSDKGGHCVTARVVKPDAGDVDDLPLTSSIAPCNDATPTYQKFEYDQAAATIKLRDWCMSAGIKGMNAGVTLRPCTGAKNQQWHFTKAPPEPPGPPPPPPAAAKLPEWGQGFGPLNMKLLL